MGDDGILATRETERAITKVLVTYTTAIDTKNWQLLEGCFTDDCVVTFGSMVMHGARSVVEHIEPSHAPIDGSLHRLSNIRVDVAAGSLIASSSSYVDALLINRLHPNGPMFHGIGSYSDQLRLDDRWRIVYRKYEHLWEEGSREILRPIQT
jgi:hypothetical protein